MVAQLSTEQQERLDDGEALLREYQSSKKLHTLNGVQFHEIIVSQVAKFDCGHHARLVAEMVCHNLTKAKKDLLDLGVTRFLKYYYCHSIDVNSWICIEKHKRLTRKKEQKEKELILASAMNKKLHM
ncbi:hypothetical protein V865_003490 [Kwoniella europaea PYCC6329]|uniref:Uncharacterized protein n=1 Tax=Kwoniella europaea PYCC6329 TaxID=1423913 RepID=A0AAX4KH88_9TREE